MRRERVSSNQLLRRMTVGLAVLVVAGLAVSIWSALQVETFDARVTECTTGGGRGVTYSCDGVWRDPIDGTERTGPISGIAGPAPVDVGTVGSVRATRYPDVVQQWNPRATIANRVIAAVATCWITIAVLVLTRKPTSR